MPPLPELLEKAQALSRPDATAEDLQGLVDELLGRLLLTEGPPVEPVPGLSEDLRTAIARSPKGKPWAVAHTWTTGPWRCLLLESPSYPWRRPVYIPRHSLAGKKTLTVADLRVVPNHRTQMALRRIVAACHALEIAQPMGEGAVHAVFGEHRTFVAWRPRESDEGFHKDLRGDADNFAKTALDALQAAGVMTNDRGVYRLSAVKDLPAAWVTPPAPLEAALRDEIQTRRGHGAELETIRVDLRLSRAHMGRLLPGEYRAPGSRIDPGTAAAAARRALELIASGRPYLEARRETGAPAAALREVLAAHLRPRVLQGSLSLHDLARELTLDPRTASGLFRGDQDAQVALRAAPNHVSRAEAASALDRALDDIHAGMGIPEAARTHGVPQPSLRARIQRERKLQASKAARNTARAKQRRQPRRPAP
jgi:Psq-like protein/endodeoxyribonuclease RusA